MASSAAADTAGSNNATETISAASENPAVKYRCISDQSSKSYRLVEHNQRLDKILMLNTTGVGDSAFKTLRTRKTSTRTEPLCYVPSVYDNV